MFGGARITAALGFWLVLPVSALAADYYVDNSCSHDGNGLAVTCASGSGQSGARRDLQAFLDGTVLQPGDTVYIRAGHETYVTTNGSSLDANYRITGFHVRQSGTPGNPITIRNYPGERPTLAACADGTATILLGGACDRFTISLSGRQYIRVTGLRIRGSISASNGGGGPYAGIVIDGNEIFQGYSSPGSGNWAGISLQGTTGAWVHHNYIHDIVPLAGYATIGSVTWRATAAVKLYSTDHSTLEWNTIVNTNQGGASAAIDDKQEPYYNVYRYNRFSANFACFRFNVQGSRPLEGVQVYHNVLDATGSTNGTSSAIEIAVGPYSSIDVHNNTFYGYTGGVWFDGSPVVGTPVTRIFNNIFAGTTNTYGNIQFVSAAQQSVPLDYNAYTPNTGAHLNGTNYGTLADVQANTLYEQHSHAPSSFGLTTNLQLTATSPCRGKGRTQGMSTGGAMDQGAYAASTTCVGHLCLSGPQNVRVQ